MSRIKIILETLAHDVQVSYNDIEEMGRNAPNIELLLRVVEVAAVNRNEEHQTWARDNLFRCLKSVKNDVLVMINIFELLQRLDANILNTSMEILFKLRHDKTVTSMGMSYCALVKERGILI